MSSQTNFDIALERIAQAINEQGLTEKENPEVFALLENIADAYVLVQWPNSQKLMEEDWFEEEAILEVEGNFGGSAYFVPLKRIL